MSSDLHTAIVTAWDASNLDAAFKAYWNTDHEDEFDVLHDQQAGPAQPMPYCVFEQEGIHTINARMSSIGNSKREIRDFPWRFTVHTRIISPSSAKSIGALLIKEITKIFGGHETESPSSLSLEHGNFLIAQYLGDWGVSTGDQEYSWIVRYNFRADVPMAV